MYSEPKQILAEQLELKRPAVLAVSGLHNSGKTTLLEKLLPALRSRGLKVAPTATVCGRPGPRVWPSTPASATC